MRTQLLSDIRNTKLSGSKDQRFRKSLAFYIRL